MGAFWGSLSALGIGLSDLFGRRVVAVAGPLTAAAVMQGFAMLASLAAIALVASELVASDLLIGGLSGVGLGTGLGCYYGGLARSTSTVVAPVVATLSAVIPFGYALLRGASASSLAMAGAVVAFIGLAVISRGDGERARVRDGLRWGLASGVGYGFGLSAVIEASEESGVWPAIGQRAAAMFFLAAVAARIRVPVVPPRRQQRNAAIAGLFGGLTTIFYLFGVQADAPSAVVTASLFPVFSVGIGWLYYRDTVTRQQLLGIAIALVGVALVVSG